MKKEYTQPIVEVIEISSEDIVTTSLTGYNPGDNEGEFGDIL